MKDLFIGSEGTLGIVTEVLLKLVPRPAARRTMLALYDRIEDAADTVSAIIAAKIIPCTLEFLDHMTIRCVEDYAHVGLPTDCGGGAAHGDRRASRGRRRRSGRMAAIARAARRPRSAHRRGRRRGAARWPPPGAAPFRRWRAGGRRRFSRTSPCRAASWRRWCASSRETAREHRPADRHVRPHGRRQPAPDVPDRRARTPTRCTASSWRSTRSSKTLALGGTITGEHGVGLAKKRGCASSSATRSYELLKQVKRALDPDGLLNPGKIFD